MSGVKLTKPQLARLREIEQGRPATRMFADCAPVATHHLVDLGYVARGKGHIMTSHHRTSVSMRLGPPSVRITDAGRAALAEAERVKEAAP